jgi:hypothetical protein
MPETYVPKIGDRVHFSHLSRALIGVVQRVQSKHGPTYRVKSDRGVTYIVHTDHLTPAEIEATNA